jgi:hypothetical protein
LPSLLNAEFTRLAAKPELGMIFAGAAIHLFDPIHMRNNSSTSRATQRYPNQSKEASRSY